MKMARPLLAVGLLSMAAVALSGWQRFGGAPSPGLQPSYDQSDLSIPSEFFFSRLRYNTGYGGRGNRRFGAGWAQDFPRADHDCLVALRRLTRIDSPSPLNVVDIDDDHMWDYPWIDAVVEDIPDDDAIFHVLYDIREKFQIPGEQYVATGRTYEKDGYIPGWRCIRDKDGHIVVAICFNMHLGDAWEWANAGDYPEKFSGLAFRIESGRQSCALPICCIRDKDGHIVVAICFNMHLGDAWEWANAGDYPEKFSGLAFRIVLNYIPST